MAHNPRDFSVTHISTFRRGVLVNFEDLNYRYSKGPIPQDMQDQPQEIAFYDASPNGRLDTGDFKVSFYQKPPPHLAKSVRKTQNGGFFKEKVTQEDIDHFGEETGRHFRAGKAQRDQVERLNVLIRGARQGLCRPSWRDLAADDTVVEFSPPLSLRTTRTRKSVYPTQASTPSSADPARCDSASAKIDADLPGVALSGPLHIEKDDIAGPWLFEFLEMFGLSNAKHGIDVFYRTAEGLKVDHIDVASAKR